MMSAIVVLVSISLDLYKSFVLLQGWKWFVMAPRLSDRPLNIFIILGFLTMIRTISGYKEPTEDADKIFDMFFSEVIYTSVAWAFLAIYHR